VVSVVVPLMLAVLPYARDHGSTPGLDFYLLCEFRSNDKIKWHENFNSNTLSIKLNCITNVEFNQHGF
jgi:hypothetical protein